MPSPRRLREGHPMHAYRRFIQDEMDKRGWKATDLARASGVSKQVLSTALNDTRDQLRMMPSHETVAGLARAFGVPQRVILHKVAEAMGLPAGEEVVVYDASRVSDDELINELIRRFRAARRGGGDDESAPIAPPNGSNGRSASTPEGFFIAESLEPTTGHGRAATRQSRHGPTPADEG